MGEFHHLGLLHAIKAIACENGVSGETESGIIRVVDSFVGERFDDQTRGIKGSEKSTSSRGLESMMER